MEAKRSVYNACGAFITFSSLVQPSGSVKVNTLYKHLGGYVQCQSSMKPEVRHRSAQSLAVDLSIKRSILQNSSFRQRDRMMVSDALSLSKLCFNAAIWTKLSAKDFEIFSVRYMARVRLVQGRINPEQCHWSDVEVLVGAHKISPAEHLRMLAFTVHMATVPSCTCGVAQSCLGAAQ